MTTRISNETDFMKYRPDIDGLRAIAVVPVVLYHANIPGWTGGYIGVDIFFVISGFLITTIVASEVAINQFSLASFYERRARRILPALVPIVLVSLLSGWFILLPSEFQKLGQSVLSVGLFLSNVFFWLSQGYFAPSADFSQLLHTWSLAVEEQFYIFFPPLFSFIYSRWGKNASIASIAIISLASLIAATTVIPLKPTMVFYLLPFRAWELGVGALLAVYVTAAPRNKYIRDGLGIIGLVAISTTVFIYDDGTVFPGLAALPPVIGSALIIYSGFGGAQSLVNNLLSHRAFVWIGLLSYSLYLWHWTIFAYVKILINDTHLPLNLALPATFVSLIAAYISLRFIEAPFRKKSAVGLSKGKIFLFAGTALGAMVVLGGILHLTHGVETRLAESTRRILAVGNDEDSRKISCLKNRPAGGLCAIGKSIGKDDTVDFLLWGDSHAFAVMPGVEAAAQHEGKAGLFAGVPGCLPSFIVRRVPEDLACSKQNKIVLAMLKERKDIPLVILSARWAISVDGNRYRNETGKSVELDFVSGVSDHLVVGQNSFIVEAGLNQTVAEIVATGRRVVLLGPIPEVGYNLPRIMAMSDISGQPLNISITRKDFEDRSGPSEAILKRVASGNESVVYVSLSDIFCDTSRCATTNETGLPLYVDDDHISRSTSIGFLAGPLETLFY